MIFTAFLCIGSLALAQTEIEERLDHPPVSISPAKERGTPPAIKKEELLGIVPSNGDSLKEEGTSLQTGGEEKPESRPTPLPLEKVQGTPSAKPLISEQEAVSTRIYKFLYDVILVIVGGLTAGIIMIIYFQWRRRMEYRSLLLAFVSELVQAFERCGIYYRQSSTTKKEVSFSAIFDFTDASMIARLAAVSKNPELMDDIIKLKSTYFQVNRHAEKASEFAAEAMRSLIHSEKAFDEGSEAATTFLRKRDQQMGSAWQAQGSAVAFFIGTPPDNRTYEKVKTRTESLIQAARKISRKRDQALIDILADDFKKTKNTIQAIKRLRAKNAQITLESIEEEERISRNNRT